MPVGLLLAEEGTRDDPIARELRQILLHLVKDRNERQSHGERSRKDTSDTDG